MKRKKSKKYITPLLRISGIILLVAFLFSCNRIISLKTNAVNTKETVQSAYPGVDIITEIHDETLYSMAVHYPEFAGTSLNEQIQQYVSMGKEEFLYEVERNKDYLREDQASLYILFEIYPIVKDMYSIVFNMESYVVGANGRQISKVFIVDVKEDAVIQQDKIIVDSEQNRDKIYKLLLNEFEQSEEYSDFFFKDYLQNWIKDENNHFSNMFLTENSIVFKFDKHLVTAGAAGSPEISIPFEQAREFISDDWQEKLYINIKEDEGAEPEEPNEPNEPAPDEQEEVTDPNEQPDSENNTEENIVSDKKRVALTFDDGPHNTNTMKILDLLDKHNAKATFFMLGNRVNFYPDIAKEIVDRGHEPGNHTWNHKDLTTLGEEEIKLEIQRTNDAIQTATSRTPVIYRPPYGAVNDYVKEAVDMESILWTVDTEDWKSRDAKQVLLEVQTNVKDGSVVLLHDIHGSTVEAVELILEFLDKEGYEFVTVSELNLK